MNGIFGETPSDEGREQIKAAASKALSEVMGRAHSTSLTRAAVEVVLDGAPPNTEGILATTLFHTANEGLSTGFTPEQALWFAAGAVAYAKAATQLHEQPEQ
jgi:hypothetical protein